MSYLALTFPMLLDTRPWKLDKSTVRLVYARTMISGVFVSGAVKYNSTTNYNVLIIGLGGGVINNYLSSMPNQKVSWTKKLKRNISSTTKGL